MEKSIADMGAGLKTAAHTLRRNGVGVFEAFVDDLSEGDTAEME